MPLTFGGKIFLGVNYLMLVLATLGALLAFYERFGFKSWKKELEGVLGVAGSVTTSTAAAAVTTASVIPAGGKASDPGVEPSRSTAAVASGCEAGRISIK